MKIDSQSGVWGDAEFILSPHHDDRPKEEIIDLLVIHNISLPPGQFGTSEVKRFFTGQLDVTSHPYFQTINHLRVSSHLFIERTGHVIQFVPFHLRAWHAGESFFAGRTQCNDFSIGIELEGTDEVPYEEVQYQTLAEISRQLMHVYPQITRERIVGHATIAPLRKTDPGLSFDWKYFFEIL